MMMRGTRKVRKNGSKESLLCLDGSLASSSPVVVAKLAFSTFFADVSRYSVQVYLPLFRDWCVVCASRHFAALSF